MIDALCHALAMRGNLGLFVSSSDRARLAAIAADRNRKQKHVWRAHVVPLTGDRVGTAEIMRRTDLGKVSVWRWQERYIEAGFDGLDMTRGNWQMIERARPGWFRARSIEGILARVAARR